MSENQEATARQCWKLAKALSPAILGKDENRIWSPSCVAHLLTVARRGATGATFDELDALLGSGDLLDGKDPFGLVPDITWGLENYEVQTAAAIWLSEVASPQPEFLDACNNGDVHVSLGDLNDPHVGEEISSWISEETRGLLSPHVELSPGALVCLVNALYLKDKWADKFAKTASEVQTFHGPFGDVDAVFMRKEDDMRIIVDEGFTLVSLPLWSGVDVLLALPDAGDSDLGKILSLFERAAYGGAGYERIDLSIPRFECETVVDDFGLLLEAVGVTTASEMNLSPMVGMTSTPTQFVHGAKLSVDEDGVEAGAYTEMIVCEGMEFEPPQPRRVVFDRPFFVALVSRTGTPLFVGSIARPSRDMHVWRWIEIPDDPNIWYDIEVEGQCRLTVERNPESHAFEITCEIYGSMVHTIFADSYDEMESKRETIQRELDGFVRLRDDDGFDELSWIEDFVSRWQG